MEKEFEPYRVLWKQLAAEVIGEMKLTPLQAQKVTQAADDLFENIRKDYENYTNEPTEANEALQKMIVQLEAQLQDIVKQVEKNRKEVPVLIEKQTTLSFPQIQAPSFPTIDTSASPPAPAIPNKTQTVLKNLEQNLTQTADLITKLKSDIPKTTQKAHRIKEVKK